jgi:outer membrane protein TolC
MKIFLSISLALISGLIFLSGIAAGAESDDLLVITDLKIENYPDAARITLHTNRYFEYIDYSLQGSPAAIMFDPTEPLYTDLKEVKFDKDGLITAVKLVKAILGPNMPLGEGFYPIDYFMIELSANSMYHVSQRANNVVIDIGSGYLPPQEPVSKTLPVQSYPKEPQTSVAKQPGAVEIPQQMPPIGQTFREFRDKTISESFSTKSTKAQLPEGKDSFTYKECLEIGTINYLPLVIAEEEIKLNGLKLNEAKRGLYPTATAKYTTTDGKTLGVEFTEKSYGLQVEQPLYYGGRLKLALKQAQVNKEVAMSKFDKTESDVASKITETFYNMATAQLNLQDQKELFEESKGLLAVAEKKYQAELTTKLELLNVQSQCNQIEYQLAVAAKDLEIARVNLLQAMDVDPSREVFVDFSVDYAEKDIDLNQCLLLAYQNRSELTMNELLDQAAEYEQKIAKAKDDFKVDFTGFLGQSGGAYKTEPLTVGSDWYAGLKVSKPWLGNTGGYSYTKNKTSPKLGQSTRTEGISHSLEFGILSNMPSYSEKQSALINKLKAENDLAEIEKSINQEVREAYNNYQKAVIQIENTRDKIAFRQEELKILKSQADINEALLSQVLEAMVKLNDEKALYHQAIASYKTALANLNKAIGIIGYFE